MNGSSSGVWGKNQEHVRMIYFELEESFNPQIGVQPMCLILPQFKLLFYSYQLDVFPNQFNEFNYSLRREI